MWLQGCVKSNPKLLKCIIIEAASSLSMFITPSAPLSLCFYTQKEVRGPHRIKAAHE